MGSEEEQGSLAELAAGIKLLEFLEAGEFFAFILHINPGRQTPVSEGIFASSSQPELSQLPHSAEEETSVPTRMSLAVTNSKDEEQQRPPSPSAVPHNRGDTELMFRLQGEASERILKALGTAWRVSAASPCLGDRSDTRRVGRAVFHHGHLHRDIPRKQQLPSHSAAAKPRCQGRGRAGAPGGSPGPPRSRPTTSLWTSCCLGSCHGGVLCFGGCHGGV